MYKTTTGPYFLKYGNIIEFKDSSNDFLSESIELQNKPITNLYRYSNEIIITCVEGIGVLCVLSQDNNIEEFEIHRQFTLKAHVCFNITSLTDTAKFTIKYPNNTNYEIIKLPSPFVASKITKAFSISEIYSYYYSIKAPNYYFSGEQHNYYELIYVDNGSLNISIGNTSHQLDAFDIIIIKPNDFHSLSNTTNKPCSFLSISFNLDDDLAITNKIYKIKRSLLNTLYNFTNESSDESNIKIPYYNDLVLCYLKLVIIELLQYDYRDKTLPTNSIHLNYENDTLNKIINYINDHIYEDIPIDDICHKFSLSRSSLHSLFKTNISIPPKQYINEEKLKKSRILIQESKYNISQIADLLGFNSIHYFSKKFTQRYKINPSEYAKSIYKKESNL